MEEGSPCSRANGRSLIYEPGAAPPPVITVYLVRARAAARRPLPPSAQSRFRWRLVCSVTRRVRSALCTSSEPSSGTARECTADSTYGVNEPGRVPTTQPLPCAGSERQPARQHAARQAFLRPPRLHRYLTVLRHPSIIAHHT